MEEKGFAGLTGISRGIHGLLSVGRWLLFVFPVLMPLVYVHQGPASLCTEFPYGAYLVVDVVVALLLAAAVLTAILEQARWKRPQSAEPAGDGRSPAARRVSPTRVLALRRAAAPMLLLAAVPLGATGWYAVRLLARCAPLW